MYRIRLGRNHLMSLGVILCLSLVQTAMLPAMPAQESGNEGHLGSRSEGAYLEYKVTGAKVERQKVSSSESYKFTAKMTAKTIVLEGKYYLAPPVGCTEEDFYYHTMVGEIIVKRPGQEETRVKQSPLVWGGSRCRSMETYDYASKLEYSPAPGETVTLHAVVSLCKENTTCHPYEISIPIVIPKLTETPPITATPEKSTQIRGRLTVPGLSGEALALRNATLSIFRGSTYLGQTFTDAQNGIFSYTVNQPGNYEIRAFLEHAEGKNADNSLFIVVYDQQDDAAYLDKAFSIPDSLPSSVTADISFTGTASVAPGEGIPLAALNSLGLMYYYTHQAADLATIKLNMKERLLESYPLRVRGFSSETAAGGTFYSGPQAQGGNNSPPYISINPEYSNINRQDLYFTVWHEFGHHIMARSLKGNPYGGKESTAHAGFSNPNTTDSWVEGFASFYAALVAKEIAGRENPQRLQIGSTVTDYEINNLSWYGDEERAVTCLLWDLIDPVDAEDKTELWTSSDPDAYTQLNIRLGASPKDDQRATFSDRIQIPLDQFWKVFTTPSATGWGERSPVAPADYNYIYDVRQLYLALKEAGVGKTDPQTQKSAAGALSPLDSLFIAQGLFADTTPQNLFYDTGEAVGLTSNRLLEIGDKSYAERIPRRIPPPQPAIYLEYSARNLISGEVVQMEGFTVTVTFEGTYKKFDYTYDVRTLEPGKLRLSLPGWNFPFNVSITARDESYQANNPLQISSQEYWQRANSLKSGAFMTHSFSVTPRMPDTSRFWEQLVAKLDEFADGLESSNCCGSLLLIVLGGFVWLRNLGIFP